MLLLSPHGPSEAIFRQSVLTGFKRHKIGWIWFKNQKIWTSGCQVISKTSLELLKLSILVQNGFIF
jgi:hypothetical protein